MMLVSHCLSFASVWTMLKMMLFRRLTVLRVQILRCFLENQNLYFKDTNQTNATIDLVFLLDATGSIADNISEPKHSMNPIVNQLKSSTSSFRIALITYKDFGGLRGGAQPLDYPSKIEQGFTTNDDTIKSSIDAISV